MLYSRIEGTGKPLLIHSRIFRNVRQLEIIQLHYMQPKVFKFIFWIYETTEKVFIQMTLVMTSCRMMF